MPDIKNELRFIIKQMKTKENLRGVKSLNFIIMILTIAAVFIAFSSCNRNKKTVAKLIEMIPLPPPPPPVLIYLDSSYLVVDQIAEFKTGDKGDSLWAYVCRNIAYPEDAKKGNVQGKSWISYDVEKDGSISNVTVSKSSFPSLDAEAVRVISSLPKFEKPAIQNGEPITTRYKILISFVLK
jgi:periplasmic protein TonB